MLEPGDTLNHGAYRIEGRLGAGGFGMVYLAEEVMLHRKVAIKTILPEVAAAEPRVAEVFYAEARVTAELGHPYIIPIYFVGEERVRGRLIAYVVMECVEGGDLETVLARGGADLAQRLRWMQQIAEGLAYAHQQGVIHRDLKLRNVFVARNQNVKIGDFGLAKALGSETKTVLKGLGTPGYISPEQIQGRPADARADLYALGIMYYQICTGRLPYDAPEATDPTARMMSIAYQHVHAPIPSVRAANPEVPPPLDVLIQRLMAKDPASRPPTADAVVQALAALPPPGPPGPIPLTQAVAAPPSIPLTQAAVAPGGIPLTQAVVPASQPAVAPGRPLRRKWLAVLGVLLLLGAGAFLTKAYLEDAAHKRAEALRLKEDAERRVEEARKVEEQRQAQLKAEEDRKGIQAEEEAARRQAEEARQARLREDQRRAEEARQARLKAEEERRRREEEARQARLKAEEERRRSEEEARQARLREEQRRQAEARKPADEVQEARARGELLEWVRNTLSKTGYRGLTVAVSPDRIVTLAGTVQDQRERDDAVRIAMLGPGVREVRQTITISTRQPDPGDIQRLVEQGLRENGLNLTIQVNPDRIVTLSGVVETEQKREQARRIASGVSGVTQVRDVIFIAPPAGAPTKIR